MTPRYTDPYKDLGSVKEETPAETRRRRERERTAEIRERAEWLLEHDPDIETMPEARKAAREQMEAEAEYNAARSKGQVDDKGRETRAGRATRKRKESGGPSKRNVHAAGRRTAPRSLARKTARAVAAPYGSSVSAAWTFITGGLSLVLFYVALRESRAVADFANGISTGLRAVADPYRPLVPSAGEAAPPPPVRKVATNNRRSG